VQTDLVIKQTVQTDHVIKQTVQTDDVIKQTVQTDPMYDVSSKKEEEKNHVARSYHIYTGI